MITITATKAAKKAQPEVIKFKNISGRFELHAKALRQPLDGGILPEWREVSRNSIKAVFVNKVKNKYLLIFGKYNVDPKYTKRWYGRIRNKLLSIGCVRFTAKQTGIIKKWALAYRKVK